MWDNRNLWFTDLTPMKEIVEQAEAKDGLTVCGDPADSTASGSSGDSNAILKGLLEHGYSKRALIPLVDAPVVEKAFDAGVGSTIRVQLGGSIDTERFRPLEAEIYIRALTDGVFYGGGAVPGRAGHGDVPNFDSTPSSPRAIRGYDDLHFLPHPGRGPARLRLRDREVAERVSDALRATRVTDSVCGRARIDKRKSEDAAL
jgi:hypothetical protein